MRNRFPLFLVAMLLEASVFLPAAAQAQSPLQQQPAPTQQPIPVQQQPFPAQQTVPQSQARPLQELPPPAAAPQTPFYPPGSNTVLIRKGVQLIDAGRFQDALDLFQDYCHSRPLDPCGHFWKGVCFDEMGNCAGAVQSFRDAAARAEVTGMDSAEIRTNLGNMLLKQNDPDQAVESYKKALEVDPLFGLARLNLGRALLARNDFQGALSAFDRCEEIHYAPRQLFYYRACALKGAGRKDEAESVMRRLLQDLPSGDAKKAMEQEFGLN